MRTKVLGLALFAATLGAVVFYPQLQAKHTTIEPQITSTNLPAQKPRVDVAKVDVVFVLDTTGSMSGLIHTAKEKIWSIASTMASAQPTPEIRIGLVAYRDRGDQYVTRVIDLSSDLDSVYATLMEFQADGGGDEPESVNQALFEAVHSMSWSNTNQAYQTIFLVGDAPPHMDYNEEQYPAIAAAARAKGIIINTVQCGDMAYTAQPWAQIASLGGGDYLQVEQAGSAVAFETPFDSAIAELSAKLDSTRLYFGNEEEKARMRVKVSATEKLHAESSAASLARRGVFNAAEGGRQNLLGEKELVDAVASGSVSLEEIDENDLPAALQPMAPAERAEQVAK
ncbi:MAG TPA: vWA domain-containing protein, partial [Xanthomonadales bacterium]|nr:vWA domain-containing protein [Xanthomonadales bacterium]